MNPTVFRRMQSNWGRRAHGDFTDHCFYENGFCVHCDHFFLGLAAAYGVERIRSRKLQLVCDGILTLPLVLPPTVAGFFLLYIFGVKRPVGRFFLEFFGTKIAFSWQATVLAAVAISFPLMYRSARGALQQVDENLLYAGRTLGMSEWCIFWKYGFQTLCPEFCQAESLHLQED